MIKIKAKFLMGRGGSWYDPAEDCRSSFLEFSRPDFQYSNLGLRIVRKA